MTDLEEMVSELKPTALIGAAAVPGVFTEKVVRTMSELNQQPIIFALSNPTRQVYILSASKMWFGGTHQFLLKAEFQFNVCSKAECTAEQAYTWSEGQCVFASGSPFPTFTGFGRTYEPGQGNNAYIFPGVALGVMFSGIRHVSDDVFLASAEVCPVN